MVCSHAGTTLATNSCSCGDKCHEERKQACKGQPDFKVIQEKMKQRITPEAKQASPEARS